jgi:hypothetical protein
VQDICGLSEATHIDNLDKIFKAAEIHDGILITETSGVISNVYEAR